MVTSEELNKELNDVEAIIPEHVIIDGPLLDSAKHLKLVQTGAGYDNVIIEECAKRGIYVANAAGINARGVAERVFAFIPCWYKNVIPLDASIKKGEYGVEYISSELSGKAIGAVFWISRAVLNFFRAINEIIFGLIFVSAVGLGPFPGVLAIAVHSAGMLGKFFAEAIENVDRGPIEALEATGSNRIKVITYAIVPQIMPQFIAYCLYRFEVNVRAAAVLGVVGAGGIGFVLVTNMRLFEFENLGIILFTIYITVVAIDSLTTKLRARII